MVPKARSRVTAAMRHPADERRDEWDIGDEWDVMRHVPAVERSAEMAHVSDASGTLAPRRKRHVPTARKGRGGGSLSGRTRRQSRDCRAVRDATRGAPLRGGKRGWRVLRHTMTGTARTAQSSLAQTDRQQFQRHGKSLRPFRTMPKMLLSQCFQGGYLG